ncbi:hypothetical protein DL89DRAFT_286622 [Linderina pennispora]|uniref:Uncharacterized protein n=1 Tax=Linderina pennispora TaxID=61395 RepID=A0A1Y1VXZ0_9FUNG|nr:uncharacterized protein DL89DRAFT_286622 [Linderina pennispora]ORX65895.1 hypothetical protein DL89DRAFT_286622 [Linderina pennispora]
MQAYPLQAQAHVRHSRQQHHSTCSDRANVLCAGSVTPADQYSCIGQRPHIRKDAVRADTVSQPDAAGHANNRIRQCRHRRAPDAVLRRQALDRPHGRGPGRRPAVVCTRLLGHASQTPQRLHGSWWAGRSAKTLPVRDIEEQAEMIMDLQPASDRTLFVLVTDPANGPALDNVVRATNRLILDPRTRARPALADRPALDPHQVDYQ